MSAPTRRDLRTEAAHCLTRAGDFAQRAQRLAVRLSDGPRRDRPRFNSDALLRRAERLQKEYRRLHMALRAA
jgi:hypothetical protein